ncbi:MAG: hypothetical protein AB1489_34585 [Acidobacteriota bacterium]
MQDENTNPDYASQQVYSQLNDFRLFSIVHRFFSSLNQLNNPLQEDLNFDVASLEKDILATRVKENFDDADNDIAARLSLWRQILEKFDIELSVSMLRHHFEQLGVPDSLTLEMILSFYLSKTLKLETDRDKIDLIATRWGQLVFQTRENEQLLLPAPTLRARIERIYQNLGLMLVPEKDTRESLEILEYERKQLLTIRSLREMIDKQVLLRLRKLKNSLADLFYQPIILSEVVAINISLHNTFQSLFLAEQSRLNNYLRSEQEQEQKVTSPDQMLATMIERHRKNTETKSSDLFSAETINTNTPTTVVAPDQIIINRRELAETLDSLRYLLRQFDYHLQQLQSLLNKDSS